MSIGNNPSRLIRRLIPGTFALVLLSAPAVHAQPPADGYDRRQIDTISRWADRLTSELEHLQEDISIDMQGPNARQLYQQADRVLEEAMHFQRSIRAGADRQHVYRDFQSMDRRLHDFIESARSVRSGSLQRGLARVQYADDQLHRTISVGDRTDDRQREVLARQAHSLDREAQDFARIAQRVFPPRGRGQELQDAIEEFASAASHFHGAVEKTNDPEHLARDFREVQQSWQEVTQQLNRSPQGAFLYRQARRVAQVYNEVHRRLPLESETPELRFEFRLGR